MNRSARYTLVAASFGLGMALLDVTAVNVAVPAIQALLHTDVRGLSWVIDGYTLAFASLLLLSGGLGDRLGAKRVFFTHICHDLAHEETNAKLPAHVRLSYDGMKLEFEI